MLTRKELHGLVLDVEFVLISVVQGVALTALAVEGAPMLRSHSVTTYAFLATGLLFVLSFWSVALIHAISFLTWPMDLVHYFFYFALALLECLTFAQLGRPHDWFGLSAVCFALTCALYAYDYRLILGRRGAFNASPPQQVLYQHIVRTQRFEMLLLMPAGFLFCVFAYVHVGRRPEAASTLAVAQLLLSVMFVISFVRNFSHRQRLITACAADRESAPDVDLSMR
jgi:hypothetical protein